MDVPIISDNMKLSSRPSKLLELTRNFNNAYFGALNKKDYIPLLCCGEHIGFLSPKVRQELLPKYEWIFYRSSAKNAFVINPELDTPEKRTQALDQMLREMKQEGGFVTLKGWRNEMYDVKSTFDQEPLLKMERAATCLFGMRQYGVDINGYVNHPEKGLCMWMQRRSKTKQTWPGKMDNFVGGGLSTGYGIKETAVKEAMEEANVPANLCLNLVPTGSVSFLFESERGLSPNTEFVFDLELPLDFIPGNNDGEVDDFHLLTVQEVMEVLVSKDVKTTSCPVALDFLIRKGVVNVDNEPCFPELVENLHIPLHSMYNKNT